VCGRYTLSFQSLDGVLRELDAILDPAAAELYRPRWNVAPTNATVVARLGEGDVPIIVPALWGLRRDAAPPARRAAQSAGVARPPSRLIINVRSEQVASRFAEAWRAGRCVVPADGFYEWTGEKADRRPVWFHAPDGGPLWMAGVLEPGASGGPPTFAVLTCEARGPVAAVHDRMAVLLSRDGARRYLAAAPRRLAPDDVPLEARAVSKRASSVVNDDAACIAPVEAGEDAQRGGDGRKAVQLGLF
jgi:putative SOS response-associated peptidase YedK